MQRFMKSMKSNSGMISAYERGDVLTNAEMRAAVPSLFATEAHESRSDRFVPIPTVTVIDAMRAEGYAPVFAQQARTRVPGKADFTRHILRMRHTSLRDADGHAFEIVLTNANDGTSAYKMMGGIFRFICMNGLFTGDTFAPVHVRHSGTDTVAGVLAAAARIVESAPRVLEMIDLFKGITLNRAEATAYAETVHRVRFPRAYALDETTNVLAFNPDACPVAPLDLLRTRRSVDREPSLWSALNIVQENCIKGGQRGTIIGTKGQVRNASVRAVTNINDSERINRFVWDAAESIAKARRPDVWEGLATVAEPEPEAIDADLPTYAAE